MPFPPSPNPGNPRSAVPGTPTPKINKKIIARRIGHRPSMKPPVVDTNQTQKNKVATFANPGFKAGKGLTQNTALDAAGDSEGPGDKVAGDEKEPKTVGHLPQPFLGRSTSPKVPQEAIIRRMNSKRKKF